MDLARSIKTARQRNLARKSFQLLSWRTLRRSKALLMLSRKIRERINTMISIFQKQRHQLLLLPQLLKLKFRL